MLDTNISPWIVIALEMILVGVSIRVLYIAVLRHRFLIRQLPT